MKITNNIKNFNKTYKVSIEWKIMEIFHKITYFIINYSVFITITITKCIDEICMIHIFKTPITISRIRIFKITHYNIII